MECRFYPSNPDYLVFANGDIYSRIKGKMLKPFLTPKGYLDLTIVIDGQIKHRKVHRMVAEAFLPNPECKPEINHINGIKTDNRVENLEWATRSENAQHGFDTGLIESGRKHAVIMYSLDGKELARFESITEASKQTGIWHQNISKVCMGKNKTTGGYIWRYDE